MTKYLFVPVSLALLLLPFFTSAVSHPDEAYVPSCPNLYRNLSFGSRGQDVIELQTFLIAETDLAPGNNTGYFGRLTEGAVKSWQAKNGVVSSGSAATTGYGAVGPRTRAKIAGVCGGGGGSVSANLSVTPTSGSAPLTVAASFSVPERCPYGYEIDWGDGNTFPDVKPNAPIPSICSTNPGSVEISHTYTQPGTYTITLKNPTVKTVTITVTGSTTSCQDDIYLATAPKREVCTAQTMRLQCPRDASVTYSASNGCDISALKARGWTEARDTTSLHGKVTKTTGNCMPQIYPGTNSCSVTPVSRIVYIYPPVTWEQRQAGQYPTLIAAVMSDADGFYSAAVPPGSYSIFVEDEGSKYCTITGGGFVCPVTVSSASTQHDININAASW